LIFSLVVTQVNQSAEPNCLSNCLKYLASFNAKSSALVAGLTQLSLAIDNG
jgi:hypothetical protein